MTCRPFGGGVIADEFLRVTALPKVFSIFFADDDAGAVVPVYFEWSCW